MKQILQQTRVIAAASLLLSIPLRADNPPPGMVNFPKFTKPTNGELVEINLNDDKLALAAEAGGHSEPDLAHVLRELPSIHVSVVGLDDQKRDEVNTRMKSL